MSAQHSPATSLHESDARRWSGRANHLWAQALLILLVLALSMMPFLLTQRNLNQSAFFLLLGAVAVLFFMRWPAFGIAVLVLVNLTVPVSIQALGAYAPIAVPLVGGLFLLLVFDFIRGKKTRFVHPGPIKASLALLLMGVLAFIVGQAPWFPFAQPAPLTAQLAGLGIYVVSVMTFLLAAHQLQDLRWLKIVTWLVLLFGGLYILSALIPGLTALVGRFIPGGATGSLLWTWMTAMAFSQALFNHKMARGWRWLLGALVLGTFYVNLFEIQRWASGWLPPLVALIAVVWVRSPRFGLVFSIVAGTALALNPAYVNQVLFVENAYSIRTRLEAWSGMIEIMKVSPFFGLGPANYFYYTTYFPIFGSAINFNSHNNYIDMIVQTGLIGLAAFLWFAWTLARLGWQLRLRVPDGFARAYVVGALGGLVGTLAAGMMGDWVLPFVYNIGLNGLRASLLGWMFMGGLTALAIMYPAHPSRLEAGSDV